ncbi:efflux RND transporter periplasmic adaptor subunit [Candidatus Latescibacterota bacterium]
MNIKYPDIKKLKSKKLFIGGVALIIIAGIILIVRASTDSPNIATFEANVGEFIIDIRESGELKAAKSSSAGVPRRVYGQTRIVRIVEDGTIVKEGDFLVQFDTSESEKRVLDVQNVLQNAKAELTSQRASIESNMGKLENDYLIQQYSYEQSKLKYQQMEFEAESRKREQELEFKKAELLLQQAKEEVNSQKIIDEANISKADLKVKQAESNLKEAQEMLDALTLTAPKSGMVVLQEIYGMSGGREKVKVGSTPYRGMELVSIPDLSVMQVKTKVNEIDISSVAVGQQVVITLDALEGPTFYGKVTNVATLARSEMGSDEKIFDVEVTIEGEDERLKPGMTAKCKIVTNKIDEVLFVPLETVFEKEDTTVVYVKNGRFKRRPIKTGAKNSDYIIIEEGLSEGEVVALRDPTLPLKEIGIEEAEESGNKK